MLPLLLGALVAQVTPLPSATPLKTDHHRQIVAALRRANGHRVFGDFGFAEQ